MTDAEKFVQLFTRNWSAPAANLFADQFHPDGTLVHPGMDRPMGRKDVVAYAERLLRSVPDIRLEPLDWAARGNTLFIEWRITATVNGQRAQWEGVDRFNLEGARAVKGIAYFDSLPVWALVDPSMKRGHGQLLDALTAIRAGAAAVSDPSQALIREYAAAKNRGDVEGALDRCAEDFQLEIVPYGVELSGRGPVRDYYADLYRAFPDYLGEAGVLAGGCGLVAAEWRFRGTMSGAFLGHEATGRSVDVPMVSLFTIENSRIASERIYFDRATLEEQAGIVRSSAMTAAPSCLDTSPQAGGGEA